MKPDWRFRLLLRDFGLQNIFNLLISNYSCTALPHVHRRVGAMRAVDYSD